MIQRIENRHLDMLSPAIVAIEQALKNPPYRSGATPRAVEIKFIQARRAFDRASRL